MIVDGLETIRQNAVVGGLWEKPQEKMLYVTYALARHDQQYFNYLNSIGQ
jgi:hypothetical protein